MAYGSLGDFLDPLAAAGQLARVAVEVDSELEIAEITRRAAAEQGPALLFERVRGQSLPVLTNLLGTTERACLALDLTSLDEIGPRMQTLVDEHTPQNWFERLKTSPDHAGANKFLPKTAKSGACQQVVHLGRDVKLSGFPLVKCWEGETGPAVTAGVLVSHAPHSGARSVSRVPLVVVDDHGLAVVDDGHSALARHWANCRAAGERLPVAVVLGGDPALLIASALELPAIDPFHACGLLRGKALDLVKCRTHDVEVPAEVDLVLEGYLDPAEQPVSVSLAAAGAWHLRSADACPVFHVTAITHRTRPILPATIDNQSGGETSVLFAIRERLLLPALRGVAPDLVDLHLPNLGGPQRFAFAAVRKRFAHHTRQIAAALLGTDALKFTKFLVLVDADVDVHDARRVLGFVGANATPAADVFGWDAPPHGSDHAHPAGGLARTLVIDATTKLPDERPGPWPTPLTTSEPIRELVTNRWGEYGAGRKG